MVHGGLFLKVGTSCFGKPLLEISVMSVKLVCCGLWLTHFHPFLLDGAMAVRSLKALSFH